MPPARRGTSSTRGSAARGRGRGAPKPKPKPAGPSVAQMKALVEERRKKAEEERIAQEQAEREAEEERLREEEERKRVEAERARKREAKKAKVKELKDKGLYKSQKQLERERALELRRKALLESMAAARLQATKEVSVSEKEEESEQPLEQSPPSQPEVAPSTSEESELDDWEAMLSSSEEEEEDVQSEEEPSSSEEEEDSEEEEGLSLPPDFTPLTEKQYKKLLKAPGVKGRRELDRYNKLLDLYQEKLSIQKSKRSPICCILGHVDCGKTLILDKIRQTNVQEGEAGGITQQIGATFFPMKNIEEKCESIAELKALQATFPGLLIIDTPGHESFTNLRARGSSLCDLAILVVDIMDGLQQQTRESIGMLKQRRTPFIVALNKVDRMYSWVPTPNAPIQEAFAKQTAQVHSEFDTRWVETRTSLSEEGFNCELYYKNVDDRRFVNVVPTSAITGEGIPDLLYLLVKLTQTKMLHKLTLSSTLECTVLEVKSVEGLGTTVDVILSNGVLRKGDTIVICGMSGPIVTTVRALLTPQPMKELRVKTPYVSHDEIRAAMGLKIYATELDTAIAGSQLLVAGPDDDIEELEEEVMKDLQKLLDSVKTVDKGVYVQASTLGSLEALMSFLKDEKIPVAGVGIGTVHRKDVMKASIMLERGYSQFGVILAFDVKIAHDARQFADEIGVKIFTADIIYHLTSSFAEYQEEVKKAEKEAAQHRLVFPVKLSIVRDCVFNTGNPIIIGVKVDAGTLKIGTPLFALGRGTTSIGRVVSIQVNHKPVNVASVGQEVAIRIQSYPGQPNRYFGKHFNDNDLLCSKITRDSIDAMKTSFREELTRDVVELIQILKKVLDIC